MPSPSSEARRDVTAPARTCPPPTSSVCDTNASSEVLTSKACVKLNKEVFIHLSAGAKFPIKSTLVKKHFKA